MELPEVTVEPSSVRAPGVATLVRGHLALMRAITPAQYVCGNDLDELDAGDVAFYVARRQGRTVGCGAVRIAAGTGTGEIKSMHVAASERGRGVGGLLLGALERHARDQGVHTLQLETGVAAPFGPARALYAKHGFVARGPFGAYTDSGHSAFYEKRLDLPRPGG